MCAHSCPTLCDPKDRRPPGSSVQGISQEKVLEWVAISFSNASNCQVYNTVLLTELYSTCCTSHAQIYSSYYWKFASFD